MKRFVGKGLRGLGTQELLGLGEGMCSPTGELSECQALGLLRSLPHIRAMGHGLYSTPLLSQENLNPIMAFSLQGPAPNQEHPQSCLIRKKDIPITQEISRISGALCQRTMNIFYYHASKYLKKYLAYWVNFN